MKEKRKDLTPPYAGFLVRLTRPFPDFDFSFIKPLREKAVELLHPKQGDRVLDMGCGPGLEWGAGDAERWMATFWKKPKTTYANSSRDYEL